MAKIVLSMDGVVLQEMTLSKERITIGRRPHNDLVIDNSAVSAEHAVIVTMLQDALLEDLNSTNGTRVNGQVIKKHFLKNNDVIELAKYKIRFMGDESRRSADDVFVSGSYRTISNTSTAMDKSIPKSAHQDGNTVLLESTNNPRAVIKILSGDDTGKEMTLTKPLTSIGVSGQQMAVVTRRGQTYSLTHVEGSTYPVVNGKSIGTSAYSLVSGDRIKVSVIVMEFLLI